MFTHLQSGSMPRAQRRGFTIIESLVAIGVLGLVMSLGVPALQAARERSRRLHCLNNLKQLGLACEALHAGAGVYPEMTRVRRRTPDAPLAGHWVSPHARLLPYLDVPLKVDVYAIEDHLQLSDTPPLPSTRNPEASNAWIPVLLCPSDGPMIYAGTSYRGCMGARPNIVSAPDDVTKIEFRANLGYFRADRAVRDDDFLDGKSNTVAFGERLVGDFDPSHFTPWRDVRDIENVGLESARDAEIVCGLPFPETHRHESYWGSSWLIAGPRNTFYNHVFPPNSRTPDCACGGATGAYSARSLHTGGVNVVTADGAAHFVSNAISTPIWRALSTLAGTDDATSAWE